MKGRRARARDLHGESQNQEDAAPDHAANADRHQGGNPQLLRGVLSGHGVMFYRSAHAKSVGEALVARGTRQE